MDKLKGLKLSTGISDPNSQEHNPLSPETSDVAIGSFSSFAAIKGMPNPSSLASKPSQPPSRRIAPLAPPESIAAQQRQDDEVGSLNAFAASKTDSLRRIPTDEKQDDLFALPMSPKAAATTADNSAFSFSSQDTDRYVSSKTA